MNIDRGGDQRSAVLLSFACLPRDARRLSSTMPNDLKDSLRRVVRRAAVRGNVVFGGSTNGRQAGGQVTFPAASHRRLEGSNNHSRAEALPDRC